MYLRLRQTRLSFDGNNKESRQPTPLQVTWPESKRERDVSVLWWRDGSGVATIEPSKGLSLYTEAIKIDC